MTRAEYILHQLLHQVPVATEVENVDGLQVLHEVNLSKHHVQHALVNDLVLLLDTGNNRLADGEVDGNLDAIFVVRLLHFFFLLLIRKGVES